MHLFRSQVILQVCLGLFISGQLDIGGDYQIISTETPAEPLTHRKMFKKCLIVLIALTVIVSYVYKTGIKVGILFQFSAECWSVKADSSQGANGWMEGGTEEHRSCKFPAAGHVLFPV